MAKPQAQSQFYNFAADVTYSVDGVMLSDYDPDGGVEASYPTAEERDSEVSADGIVHITENNDPRLRHTIKLMSQSYAAQFMELRMRTQRITAAAGGGLVRMTVAMFNRATGDKIATGDAYFISRNPKSAVKAQGRREFVIELPYGRDQETEDPAFLITPPVIS